MTETRIKLGVFELLLVFAIAIALLIVASNIATLAKAVMMVAQMMEHLFERGAFR